MSTLGGDTCNERRRSLAGRILQGDAMLVALAGGIGASKFLRGLVNVWQPEDLLIVVNTGDDVVMHGLAVSPDIDSVTYRLAGVADEERGWGRAEETWNVRNELVSMGEPGWYGLGDRDIAAQLLRTRLLAEGWTLSQVTTELCRRLGVSARVIPMSDDRIETRVEIDGPEGPEDLGFQEYWVARCAQDRVRGIRFAGIEQAHPAPGILEAIANAEGIIFCPSNPVVSIAPILSISCVREGIKAASSPKIAVTPIIAGAPVRGMADKLLPAWGVEVSARGVARLYADLLDVFVLDQVDVDQATDVEALGVRPVVAPTLMRTLEDEVALAQTTVDAMLGRRPS
jgi:LPPG:FO 2-phospho-L-lactate transferase